MLFLQGGERERLRTFVESSAVEERLSGVFATMNDFPGSAGKDMLFLRSLSSVSALYDNFTSSSWRSAQEDLQQFIERNTAYDEIHMHTSLCMFSVRRVRDEDGSTSCDTASGSLEDAIAHTGGLSQGSVYVSPLVSYTHKVKGKDSTIPAILYSTKVVSAPGSKEDGVIVAVIDANYFLEDIRRLKREGESVFLLNTDGSYIANPDTTKEKLAGGTGNFYADFSAIPNGTLLDPKVRQFETNDKLFTFMRITPTTNNFALYDSTKEGDSAGYWIMAAVSEKTNPGLWWLGTSYITTIAIILLTHLLVVIFMYIALFPTKTLRNLFHHEQETVKEDAATN